jgi:hypothetical protein
MAHASYIQLKGGKSYRIYEFKYVLTRTTKEDGSGDAESNCITFEFQIMAKADTSFHKLLSGDESVDGSIMLNVGDSGDVNENEIKFSDAHVIQISEEFSFEKDTQVFTKIVMSDGKVSFNAFDFKIVIEKKDDDKPKTEEAATDGSAKNENAKGETVKNKKAKGGAKAATQTAAAAGVSPKNQTAKLKLDKPALPD